MKTSFYFSVFQLKRDYLSAQKVITMTTTLMSSDVIHAQVSCCVNLIASLPLFCQNLPVWQKTYLSSDKIYFLYSTIEFIYLFFDNEQCKIEQKQ